MARYLENVEVCLFRLYIRFDMLYGTGTSRTAYVFFVTSPFNFGEGRIVRDFGPSMIKPWLRAVRESIGGPRFSYIFHFVYRDIRPRLERSRVDRSQIPPFITVKTLNLEDFETRFTHQGRYYSQLRTTRRVWSPREPYVEPHASSSLFCAYAMLEPASTSPFLLLLLFLFASRA